MRGERAKKRAVPAPASASVCIMDNPCTRERFHAISYDTKQTPLPRPYTAGKAASFAFLFAYSITSSSDTMIAMLMTMQMELIALDRPTSAPISPAKPGTAEPTGENARITSA